MITTLGWCVTVPSAAWEERLCNAGPAPSSPLAQITLVAQIGDDGLGMGFRRSLDRLDGQIGPLRQFIRAVDACEVLDLAGPGFFVKPLGIALHADLERRVYE